MSKPIQIALISVLKPVHDVRIFEKLAISIAHHFPNAEVHIIAHKTLSSPTCNYKNIHFHPLFDFSRLSWKRIFANFFVFKKLLKIKPALIISTTFELLPVSIFYKLTFKSKVIYDIQENYYLNVLHLNTFPKILRKLFALGVRYIENVAALWIDFYWLAEKCYEEELPFVKKNYITLENKPHISPNILHKKRNLYHLLLMGTLSEDFGLFRAIDLVKKLHALNPKFHLTIIGFCAKQSDWNKLQSEIKGLDFIKTIGGIAPVPHQTIMATIQEADFALMPYAINPSTQHRIPTKFYECMSYQLPMIIQKNLHWEGFLKNFPFESAIFFDYPSLDDVKILYAKMQTTFLYQCYQSNNHYLWINEEPKLVDAIKKLIF